MSLLFENPGLRTSAIAWGRRMGLLCLLAGLAACSPKYLIVQGIANELATQGSAPEDDPTLAREASAFYLKLSESLLREVPDNAKLSESLAAGFTQYAYAFVSFEADRLESRDTRSAQALHDRAAKLYGRAHRHAMTALERAHPGFRRALQSNTPSDWPQLAPNQIGLAYWAAASWGGLISLSKDQPDTVADLPQAMRLARLAYDKEPGFGNGSLASLMGSFEVARPGGSNAQAMQYFDTAIALAAQRSAGPLVAKAEAISLPAGNRAEFEFLLHQALSITAANPDLQNAVMRERAQWLLASADDLF